MLKYDITLRFTHISAPWYCSKMFFCTPDRLRIPSFKLNVCQLFSKLLAGEIKQNKRSFFWALLIFGTYCSKKSFHMNLRNYTDTNIRIFIHFHNMKTWPNDFWQSYFLWIQIFQNQHEWRYIMWSRLSLRFREAFIK